MERKKKNIESWNNDTGLKITYNIHIEERRNEKKNGIYVHAILTILIYYINSIWRCKKKKSIVILLDHHFVSIIFLFSFFSSTFFHLFERVFPSNRRHHLAYIGKNCDQHKIKKKSWSHKKSALQIEQIGKNTNVFVSNSNLIHISNGKANVKGKLWTKLFVWRIYLLFGNLRLFILPRIQSRSWKKAMFHFHVQSRLNTSFICSRNYRQCLLCIVSFSFYIVFQYCESVEDILFCIRPQRNIKRKCFPHRLMFFYFQFSFFVETCKWEISSQRTRWKRKIKKLTNYFLLMFWINFVSVDELVKTDIFNSEIFK